MPRYISSHTLGCLPKPAFAALCATLFRTEGARVQRIVAGQIGGIMLIEFEAVDQDAAAGWLATNKLRPTWLMRLDFESTAGSLRDL